MYKHLSGDHNMQDPNELVPLFYKYFKPGSVLDLGCGIGNFLYSFKTAGVTDVLGIDGPWSKNSLQMLSPNELLLQNLSEPINVSKKYDLAMSLEVAEHLEEIHADKIIADLTRFSDLIIFSAALPDQGGQNHLNEKWPSYWVEKFNAHDFVCFDAIRPLIWNNENIKFWYRQNIFIAAKNSNLAQIENIHRSFPFLQGRENIVLPMIHPLQFDLKIKRIDRLVRMFKLKASFKEYKEEIKKVFVKPY